MTGKNIAHLGKYSVVDGGIRANIDLTRFGEQLADAQYALDGAVMESMIPFMPMITGSFVNTTKIASTAVQGSGKVYAAYGPQGRFLYEGKGMVDEVTGSPFARYKAKKVLVSQYGGKTNAKENLEYTRQAHPNAQAHWFDAAKAADGKKWIRIAKDKAGGK